MQKEKRYTIKGLTCIASDKGLSLLIRVFAVILPRTTSYDFVSTIDRRGPSICGSRKILIKKDTVKPLPTANSNGDELFCLVFQQSQITSSYNELPYRKHPGTANIFLPTFSEMCGVGYNVPLL